MTASPSGSKRLIRIVLLIGGLFVFVMFTSGIMLPAIFQAVALMIVGWAPALLRIASAFDMRWSTAILVLVGIAVAFTLAHSFAVWFAIRHSEVTACDRSWSIRRTALVFSG